jgi:acyl-CoA reductase-like NAD-dependent aldehyde dehydrogenase
VTRLAVRKTYKLFIGGAFPRSESGHTFTVTGADGFVANVAKASRKDGRDAVEAARGAQPGWAGRTPYNRGQILYRVAEMLEGRRSEFAEAVRVGEGGTQGAALAQVDVAVDRWVWYSGWADKVGAVFGGANPVSGPFFNFSVPQATGVVALVSPVRPSLLGLVSVLAPVVVSGNTAVVVAPEAAAIPAATLGEVLATSDLPGGVVNLLTGPPAEIAPWLASHTGVNGLDLTGLDDDVDLRTALERAAAVNLKRLHVPPEAEDFGADPGLARLAAWLETKTVWHPMGT